MKVIFGISKIKKFKRAVVALGVYDGVHRGHRYILENAVKQARSIKGTSLVVTFWPHPQKEGSLYSLAHRLRLIAQIGIDVCVVIKFTPALANIPAEDFIQNILIKKIRAAYVYVGRNFRFGKDAGGDFYLLKRFSHALGFKLKGFRVIKVNHRNISSTYIRRLITSGNLKLAQKLLSRPVSIFGTVIKGASVAKVMGFPTANINPHHEVLPPSGIYAVKVILNKNKLNGVCYIGCRPTFFRRGSVGKIKNLRHVEVHILNFHRDIYGKDLEIQFIRRIRQEKKFHCALALAAQIKQDIKITQDIFSRH